MERLNIKTKTMKIKHFVITRFNMPIFPTRVNGEKVKNCDVDFLNNRLDIFEKYCMPSLRNQTNQNFQWLVMFDVNTPHAIKERLVRIEKNMANLSICYFDLQKYSVLSKEYIDLYNEYALKVPYLPQTITYDNYTIDSELIQRCCTPRYISDVIHEKINGEHCDYIITTRIDNDDAFHKNMIDMVQREAERQLSLKRGAEIIN